LTYPSSGSVQTRPVNLLRLLFAGLGLTALVLGYWGMAQLLAGGRLIGPQTWDILYADFQLFVLEMPTLNQGESLTPALQVARFAAPMVTIYALVEAGRLIFAVEVRRLRTRRARSHAIVCGQTVLAATVARRLRAAGQRVVLIHSAESRILVGGRNTLRVIGDPSDPDVLRAAGVRRASFLYACTHDSATNTAIALAAGRSRRRSGVPLRVYSEISDPELCLTLQARYLGPAQTRGANLDFFHADHVAARKVCLDSPLGELRPGGPPPRVLVAGLTDFGRALVVELARYWSGRALFPLPRLPLVLIDPRASSLIRRLCDRYPFMEDVCQFEPYDIDLVTMLSRGWPTDPPARMFICDDDEERALMSALTAEWLPPNSSREIAVRLDRLAVLREVFEDRPGDHLDQFTRLRVFGVTRDAGDPALIQQDLVERLARVVHNNYLRAELSKGDRQDRASLQPWESLPDSLRAANREQAEDFGRKLRLIGCVLAPRVGPVPEHQLTDFEVELLARDEHERWFASRRSAGWRYGPQQVESQRVHPGMLPWLQLPDQLREPNYRAIRAMPAILAEAGFRIVRL
jgi:hypothetical protein